MSLIHSVTVAHISGRFALLFVSASASSAFSFSIRPASTSPPVSWRPPIGLRGCGSRPPFILNSITTLLFDNNDEFAAGFFAFLELLCEFFRRARKDFLMYFGELACKKARSEEHTSELQSQFHLVCRLLLEKKKKKSKQIGDSLDEVFLTGT